MVLFVTTIQEAVASHTAQSPEVLILAVGAVAPAEHLKGKEVVARLQIRCDIELCCHLRVFGITHKLSVDIQIHTSGDTTEVGDDLTTVPTRWNRYFLAVCAHMVVFHRHFRRIVFEVSAPGKSDVYIDGVTIAVDLPDAGHLHLCPLAVVIVGAVEVLRSLVGIGNPMEAPVTVERQL